MLDISRDALPGEPPFISRRLPVAVVRTIATRKRMINPTSSFKLLPTPLYSIPTAYFTYGVEFPYEAYT